MNNYLKILMLSLVLTACSKEDKDKYVPTIKLSPSIINNPKETYDSLFKNVKYIPLETNDNCLISEISQLHIAANDIFILDGLQDNLLRFTSNGRFVNSIGRKGKGPGEYLNPSYFLVDNDNREIEIYDRRQKKIIIYNYSGKYIRNINIDLYFKSFFKDNNKYWAFMANEGNAIDNEKHLNFIKIDSTGKIVEKIFEIENYNMLLCRLAHISENVTDGVVSFVLPLHKKIYSFDKNKIEPKYIIDFQEAEVPDKELKKLFHSRRKNQKIINKLMDKYALGYHNFIELKEWIYFSYSYKKTKGIKFVLYNKKDNKVFNITKNPYKENSWETFFPIKYGINNTFYSSIHPVTFEKLLNVNKKKYTKERKNAINALLSKIKTDSNPIIIRYELKSY